MKAWLGNLHMTKKLLVSPFMALLFLLIFGVVSYFAFFKQQSALDDIYKNRFKRCLSTAATICGPEGGPHQNAGNHDRGGGGRPGLLKRNH